jgi:hypothetical protein
MAKTSGKSARHAKRGAAKTKITRDDIESHLRSYQAAIEGQVADRKREIVTGGIVGVVLILLLFFLLGRRSGKKKTTLVEIRRV